MTELEFRRLRSVEQMRAVLSVRAASPYMTAEDLTDLIREVMTAYCWTRLERAQIAAAALRSYARHRPTLTYSCTFGGAVTHRVVHRHTFTVRAA